MTWRRKRIFIGGIQYRLLAHSLVYGTGIFFTFLAALFGPLVIKLNSETVNLLEQEELVVQFLALHGRVWLPLALVFLLFVLHLITMTHRISGPLYRFEQIFQAIGEGNFSVRAHIRTRDYLRNEADRVNAMLESLSSRMQHMQEVGGELRAAVDQLKWAIESGSQEEAPRSLGVLLAHMERLKDCLDSFTTGSGLTAMDDDLACQLPPVSDSGDPAVRTSG